MTRSPSTSAQQARVALATRLAQIMRDAGLKGAHVAQAAGWHESKSSRIITGTTLPSPADIRLWCEICGVPEQAEDLIAQALAAESMYVQWRQRERAGLRSIQQSYVPLYERTRLFRQYSSTLVPGFLQTRDYAAALLTAIATFRGMPNDAEAAAAARVERSRIIREGPRRGVFLIEEGVLRNRMGDAATMEAQLGYLIAAASLPSLSVGIVPFTADRSGTWTVETFTIYDDSSAHVELLGAEVTVTAPTELRSYAAMFDAYLRKAVFGEQARARIVEAIEALAR
ncbi:helix-turn-helix domain-containing protein [Yinghuangia seranimata]|uniref:helix-turn-helix domain-containing protein n=1 Tax=Yinghuangia seranimata TaxID=408067 RepID=UPI00248B480B|nr:helix-turn-helix transcriptional regulator [Yinghuangia seranimata]MDI2127163.1 helix-turn-helix transcriptional regulator [Yinghuangia seranimata]